MAEKASVLKRPAQTVVMFGLKRREIVSVGKDRHAYPTEVWSQDLVLDVYELDHLRGAVRWRVPGMAGK